MKKHAPKIAIVLAVIATISIVIKYILCVFDEHIYPHFCFFHSARRRTE